MPDATADRDPTPWYRTRRGPPVVLGYAVVTLAVLSLSTGWLLDGAGPFALHEPVPLDVYLYGFLGGMTYAFTSLVARFERGLRGVVKVGLRALAALPLAAGVYLLAGPLGLPTGDAGLVAGLSFLVGLYVNLTLKALGGLADRLYGRASRGDGASDSGTAQPVRADADRPAGIDDGSGARVAAAPTGPAGGEP